MFFFDLLVGILGLLCILLASAWANSKGSQGHSMWTLMMFEIKTIGVLMKETFFHPLRPACLDVDREHLEVRVVLPEDDPPEQ